MTLKKEIYYRIKNDGVNLKNCDFTYLCTSVTHGGRVSHKTFIAGLEELRKHGSPLNACSSEHIKNVLYDNGEIIQTDTKRFINDKYQFFIRNGKI
jgi:hypothetical protein